ncbi:lipopolysaccharide biosynthesis protein [Catenulispora pinisilvae]|uniref:lipopolysaccharide biosynthesis protein n=1 Tax=Catenulispora pinisilvae TaxID=2705253 RepID=UPI001891A5E3|nr:lipopolysaccharide biosynthesis protein [Catenulispora pinisilvae]
MSESQPAAEPGAGHIAEPVAGPIAESATGPTTAPAAESLGDRVRSAAKWSLINTLIIRIGTFATGVILARGALTPADWGLYAIGSVAQAVLLSFNELGVSLAVVRWDRDPREFAPTVVTLATASSTLLYVGLWFLAPDLAVMLGSPHAVGVLRILCFAVVVDGMACVPNAVLMREFRQRARLTIDLLTFVVSSGLTLILAFRGWGASSFAWGGVAGVMVALVGCGIAAPGYLRPGWDRATARELVHYGAPLAGASLFVLATMNTDSAVVGATLGPVSLGLYRVAFTMSSWPVRAISETARRVSFAGFSRAAESTHTLTEGFTSGLSPLLIASVPACALLAALPGPVIRAVYGDQWNGATGALRYLAILGLLRIIFELCYDFLVAAGRSRALLTVQALWLAALIPALVIGAHHHGLSGVGMGHIIVAAGLIAPAYLVTLRAVGIRPTRILAVTWRPLLGGALIVAVALAVNHVAGNSDLAIAGAGLVALAVYVPVAVPASAMREVWIATRSRLARGRRSTVSPPPVVADESAPV